MSSVNIDQVMTNFKDVYQKLYKRQPRELQALDGEWIAVNGARMRAADLYLVTSELQREYQRLQEKRRGLVNRLIGWFKG